MEEIEELKPRESMGREPWVTGVPIFDANSNQGKQLLDAIERNNYLIENLKKVRQANKKNPP